MPDRPAGRGFLKQLFSLFTWTRHSYVLLGGFLLVVFLIAYVWWPLAEAAFAYVDWQGPWWRYFDWLLVGIFLFMTVTIMSRADLRKDALIVFVGTLGGLAIESWGTQTNLWFYYTAERPPLWIIPAWPIASLSIDRIMRMIELLTSKAQASQQASHKAEDRPGLYCGLRVNSTTLYWLVFGAFYALMLYFVAPTFHKPLTLASLLLCAVLILTPTDQRIALLTFVAGSGLGYFLELWGTTRQCWTYYTYQTPPLFAVLAHGMAAVAFWRAGLLLTTMLKRLIRATVLSR